MSIHHVKVRPSTIPNYLTNDANQAQLDSHPQQEANPLKETQSSSPVKAPKPLVAHRVANAQQQAKPHHQWDTGKGSSFETNISTTPSKDAHGEVKQ